MSLSASIESISYNMTPKFSFSGHEKPANISSLLPLVGSFETTISSLKQLTTETF